MTPESIAAVIGALSGLIVAFTTLVVAMRPILAELRKNTAVTQEAAAVGEETRHMVNSVAEAAVAQQTRSDNAMRAAGVPIPFDPSVSVQPEGGALR